MSSQLGRRAVWTLALCVLAGVLVAGSVEAREIQLAGMRMGQHAVDVLDIYGRPHAIIWGAPGGEFDTGAAAGAGGGMGEGMGPGGGEEMAAGPGAGMPEEDMG